MKNLKILILAAGKGTRMKSKKAKVLHHAGGEPLVSHVLRTAQSFSGEVFIVVGHQADEVKRLFSGVTFIEQKEQLGTGHAVMCARQVLSDFDGDLLILPGDVPLIRKETIQEFL